MVGLVYCLLSYYVFIVFVLIIIAVGMRSGPTPSFGFLDNKCLTASLCMVLFPGLLLIAIQAFYYWTDDTYVFCDFKLWQC